MIVAPKGHRSKVTRSGLHFGEERKAAYSDEYYTPVAITWALGVFDLDPCAGPMRHATINYRLPERDGLLLPWQGRVWLNPPYSTIHAWLQRFVEHGNGVALVNVRSDARWFHDFVAQSTGVLWLRGRINFNRDIGPAKYVQTGQVLVAFGEENWTALQRSGLRGLLMQAIKPSE